MYTGKCSNFDLSYAKHTPLWPIVHIEVIDNLVPRVFWVFGQRGSTREDAGTIKFSSPENIVNSLSAHRSVENGSDSFSCTYDQRVRDKFMLIGF